MRSSNVLVLLVIVALAAVGAVAFTLLGESEPGSVSALERDDVAAPGPATGRAERLAAPAREPEAPATPAATAASGEGDRRLAQESGALAGEDPAGLRWVEGTLLLPLGAEWDDSVRALSVAAPSRERPMTGFLALAGNEAQPVAETAVLYSAPVERDGSFRVACAPDAEWAYLEVDARFLYLPEPLAVRLEGDVTRVELAPLLGAAIRGRWTAPSDAGERDLVLGRGVAYLSVPADNPFAMVFRVADGESGDAVFHRVFTAPDGTFEMRGIDPRPPWVLVCHPARLASSVTGDLELEPGEVLEVEIALSRGASLSGRVVDRRGNPVPGAVLHTSHSDDEEESEDLRLFARSAVSASDGTFAIHGVAPGEVRLRAEKEGWRRGIRKKFELEPGASETGIELKLRRGEALRGLVQWSDGTPAVGAVLQVGRDATGRSEPMEAKARTLYGEYEADGAGRFEITGLKRREQSVWAFATRTEGGRAVQGVAQLDGVRPDEDDEHVLVLAPEPLLTGVVRDLEGEPVTRFRVVVRPDTQGTGSMMTAMMTAGAAVEHDVTSPDGSFRLERVGVGEYAVTVEAEGFATSDPVGVELPPLASTPPLEIVLAPFCGVSGVVLSPGGDPLPGAKVTLRRAVEGSVEVLVFSGAGPTEETTTNTRGEFVFPQEDPGELTLVAEADDFVASAPLALELAPGEVHEAALLSLRVGARLTGEVLDGEGRPAAGRSVSVSAFDPVRGDRWRWQGDSSTTTDENGWFELEELVPGKATVSLRPSQEEMKGLQESGDWESIVAGTLRREVDLVDGGTVHVVLGGEGEPEGDPVAVSGRVTSRGAGVTAELTFLPDVSGAIARGRKTRSDARGSFELELPSSGEYRVTVSPEGDGGDQTFYRIVRAAERVELDFALPGGRIAGRVYAADGEPADEVPVSIRRVGLGFPTSRTGIGSVFGGNSTDEDGYYEFEDLEEGSFVVTVGNPMITMFVGGAAGYGRTSTAPIELAADEVRDNVDILLGAPGTLAGRVVDRDGAPVAGAAVYVFDDAGRPVDTVSTVTTNAAGKFGFEGLAAGDYCVLARTPDLATRASATVEVAPEREARQVELMAEEGTLLSVKLLDASGAALRASVSVTDERGRELADLRGFSTLMGAFRTGSTARTVPVGPVAPGIYWVQARASDGRTASREVNARSRGGELEVELHLPE